MDAPAAATAWEVRAVPWRSAPAPPGAGRWGVVHLPNWCWVAFGSRARCHAVATHVTAVDGLLRQAGAPGAGPGR